MCLSEAPQALLALPTHPGENSPGLVAPVAGNRGHLCGGFQVSPAETHFCIETVALETITASSCFGIVASFSIRLASGSDRIIANF